MGLVWDWEDVINLISVYPDHVSINLEARQTEIYIPIPSQIYQLYTLASNLIVYREELRRKESLVS